MIAGHIPRRENERVAVGQGDGATAKAAETDLGALEILEDAHMDAKFLGNLTNGGDPGGVLAVVAVGKVETECGCASRDQLPEPLR